MGHPSWSMRGVSSAVVVACASITACSDGGDAPRSLASTETDAMVSLELGNASLVPTSTYPAGGLALTATSWTSPAAEPRREVMPTPVVQEATASGEESAEDHLAEAPETLGGGNLAAASVRFPYFEKTGGSLDCMGVKVTRTGGAQKLWAPGSETQEYPGGWVTPGEYLLTINVPRIHDKDDGTLTGTLRDAAAGFSPPHQLMGLVVSEPLEWEGWENHGFDDPPEFIPAEWGSSHLVTLTPGDVLHVAYGNEIVPFQKREGSDGIVVYCVEEKPEYRGGLWGLGHHRWSTEMWDKLCERIQCAAQLFEPQTSAFYYGPDDGTLPAVLPVDYQMEAGADDNEQSDVLATWILHRSMGYLKEGDTWTGSVEDLDLLFRFYCNNVQTAFMFSDRGAQHNHYAHGPNRYPPYQVRDIQRVLVGAVALGYDPNYEPLYRLLMHLAQRTEMTLTASNAYSYENNVVEGGLVAHKDDNEYTQWLWYEKGATDMGAKGSHNTCVWGPCFWARELFLLPHTAATEGMLWTPGPRFRGSASGHGWTAEGIGPGYNTGYGSLEIRGAMWLWFTDTHADSQLARWARRDRLYTTNPAGSTTDKSFFAPWVQATFVQEVEGLRVASQGSGVLLAWNDVSEPDLSQYRVFCRYEEHGKRHLLGTSTTTSFPYPDLETGKTYYFQVAAVDGDGNQGSLSEPVGFRPKSVDTE